MLTGTASYELDPPGVEEMTRRWRELVDKGYPHLVAIRSGRCSATPMPAPTAAPRLPLHGRGQHLHRPGGAGPGIGRALLGELIAICEAKGFRQMIAVIGGGTEHPASVGLHKALGFREIGMVEASGFKYGRWLDTLLMQRALGPGKTTLPKGG